MAEKKKVVIVVSESTFDKAMMSLMIGNTAASMGMEVHIFHTFFGLSLMKKGANPKAPGMYRLFTGMFNKRMLAVGVEGYEAQKKMALELGVNMYACSTTMSIMHVKEEDLDKGVKLLGAAAFLNIAADSDMQFFIG
ncbi:MAG: DsrE/DsrF/DrsH-like family protein [Methanomassiliicoccales archaeon]|nr:DsrE/DsrF/DrsH-like family protein [Methanomassiliicoccales archaeon]